MAPPVEEGIPVGDGPGVSAGVGDVAGDEDGGGVGVGAVTTTSAGLTAVNVTARCPAFPDPFSAWKLYVRVPTGRVTIPWKVTPAS